MSARITDTELVESARNWPPQNPFANFPAAAGKPKSPLPTQTLVSLRAEAPLRSLYRRLHPPGLSECGTRVRALIKVRLQPGTARFVIAAPLKGRRETAAPLRTVIHDHRLVPAGRSLFRGCVSVTVFPAFFISSILRSASGRGR